MAYQAPVFVNDAPPALDADNLNALAQCVEANQTLVFSGVKVLASAFTSNTTYTDWPYRASVPLSGVKQDMIPSVVYSPVDAASGVFAPVSASYNGGIYIYASRKPSAATTISTITCVKGVA